MSRFIPLHIRWERKISGVQVRAALMGASLFLMALAGSAAHRWD
jgi:hypothetical protein